VARAGELELLILLAIAQLGDYAYGVTVRDMLERRTSRTFTLGAIYKTVGRLEAKKMLEATVAPPTGQRGGRRKRLYHLTPDGFTAVRGSLADLGQLAKGLEPELEIP